MNFTNPGAISHNEILDLYRQYIDSNLTWHNFTIEEQAKVIVAPRSNNLLDTSRVRVHFKALSQFKQEVIVIFVQLKCVCGADRGTISGAPSHQGVIDTLRF